jgi:blue copper oxidase
MKTLLKMSIFIIFHKSLVYGQAYNNLYIPPTLTGTNFNINLVNTNHSFYAGKSTQTMAFSPTPIPTQSLLGPTIILNKGDNVTINYHNLLGEETTVHMHGLTLSPEDDGGPRIPIMSFQTYSPNFDVLDRAGTYWYHPHLHHKTAEQVSKGLAGLIIVKDAEEAALDLPRTYGIDDFPLIIQNKKFSADTSQVVWPIAGNVPSQTQPIVMINGTVKPILQVPKQIVRFRCLNGSNHYNYHIDYPSGNLSSIAGDAGLRQIPSNVWFGSGIFISPGERNEFLVDFSGKSIGDTVRFFSNNSSLSPPLKTFDNPNTYVLLTMVVGPPTANPITSIPTTLSNHQVLNDADATHSVAKYFTPSGSPKMGSSPIAANNLPYDINRIDNVWPINSKVKMKIKGGGATGHPFHIHGSHFQILEENGDVIPVTSRSWEDTRLLAPTDSVVLITKFDQFASETPYVMHCHILAHEDAGMMQNFVIRDQFFINQLTGGLGSSITGGTTDPFLTLFNAQFFLVDGPKQSTVTFTTTADEFFKALYGPNPALLNKNMLIKTSGNNNVLIR